MAFGATAALDDFNQAIFSPDPASANKYADFVNGNDTTGTGTLANPYKTVAKIIANLSAGQVGMLRAGTYTSASTYNLNTGGVANGTATNKITLMSYPGESATIAAHNYIPAATQHWRFVGITFNSTVGRNLELHGDYIIFEGCTFTNNHTGGTKGSTGISIGWNGGSATSTGCEFRRCIFRDIGVGTGHFDHGIYVERSDGLLVENCRFYGCTGGWAMQIYPNAQNVVVRFCTIDGNHGGFVYGNESGYAAFGHVIEESLVTNNGGGVAGPEPGIANYNIHTSWNGTVSQVQVRFSDVFGGIPSNYGSGSGTLTLTSVDNVDPLYTDRPNKDFRLQASSSQRGRGYEWRFLDATKWSSFGANNMLRPIFDRLGVPVVGTATKQSYYSAATFGPDVEAYATLSVLGAVTGNSFVIHARQNGATASERYSARLTINTAGNDTLEILRNGVVIGAADTTQNFAAGDALGIEVNGTTVSVYRKPVAGAWASVFSRTVSGLGATSGNFALEATGSAWEIDNFGGGNIAGVPPVEPPPAPPSGVAEVQPIAVRAFGAISLGDTLKGTDVFNLQHQRISGLVLAAGASAEVTVTWPRAFASTTYTAVVTAEETTAGESNVRTLRIVSKTAAGMVVRVTNDGASSRTYTVNAIGVHDAGG